MTYGRFGLLAATFPLWLGYAAAGTVVFDFDTGMPALVVRQNTPLDQTAGGVTAHFSSMLDPAFSVQTYGTTFIPASWFSGNFLYPNNQNRNVLQISFDQLLASLTLTFATIEYHDPGAGGTPSSLQMTAYRDSSGSPAIGSVSGYGTMIPGDYYPQGTLTFDSGGQPFNLIELAVPFVQNGATDFMLDGIIVNPLKQQATSVPEPAHLFPAAIALLALGGFSFRRTRRE